MRAVAVAILLLLGGTGGAGAQQILLAAGGLYGGPSQARAVCYIYNVGSGTANLAGLFIIDQDGAPQTLVVDQCGVAVAPGRICGVAADVTDNQPYGCRMTVDGSKDDLRGVFEMRDAQQRVLANVELR